MGNLDKNAHIFLLIAFLELITVDEMGVGELGVDEMGVDEIGSRRSGNNPLKFAKLQYVFAWSFKGH